MYALIKDVSGETKVQLIMSKSKVAQTKRVTLPRLELLAACILSKLLKFVLKVLKVSVTKTVCWSDSLVALNWIRKPSRSWNYLLRIECNLYMKIYL